MKSIDFRPKNDPLPSLKAYEFSQKNQNCHFDSFFNTFQQIKFQKTRINRFGENFKSSILGLQMDHFGQKNNFFKKIGSVTF